MSLPSYCYATRASIPSSACPRTVRYAANHLNSKTYPPRRQLPTPCLKGTEHSLPDPCRQRHPKIPPTLAKHWRAPSDRRQPPGEGGRGLFGDVVVLVRQGCVGGLHQLRLVLLLLLLVDLDLRGRQRDLLHKVQVGVPARYPTFSKSGPL